MRRTSRGVWDYALRIRRYQHPKPTTAISYRIALRLADRERADRTASARPAQERAMTSNTSDDERARLIALIDTGTNPFWETLGIVAKDVEGPGVATVGIAMSPQVTNRNGVIHGGAIMSLIDAAGGGAARTMVPAGEPLPAFPTTDLNVSFLNPAKGGVTATGRVVRNGRTLVFVQVEVHDEDGTLVALGRVTYAVVQRRA
jgi:uncharacterized protein (TIGR00369 family)